jgi:hypothetical protein
MQKSLRTNAPNTRFAGKTIVRTTIMAVRSKAHTRPSKLIAGYNVDPQVRR